MKGLELSEKFYLEHGACMIDREFGDIKQYLAFGLMGSGSECMGYDDEISRDHDFEPGFCIFLPNEDIIDSRTAFRLERAYAKLPKEYMGFKRQVLNPIGGNRHGVIRTSDFFGARTGDGGGNMTQDSWFSIEEQFLLEAAGGRIFCDNYGEVTKIRQKLSFYPEDIRLKKLAGNLLIMAQSGQYNYPRCLKRGDSGACQMCICEFVNAALSVIFLINGRYKPYYKWVFRALKDLTVLSGLAEPLEYLLSSSNTAAEGEKKAIIIEDICAKIADRLISDKTTKAVCHDLEKHAYGVNDLIKDGQIRNLHVLYAV